MDKGLRTERERRERKGEGNAEAEAFFRHIGMPLIVEVLKK